MLFQIYLCGAFVAAASVSLAIDLFSERDVKLSVHTGVIFIAAVLWPVMLIGLLQFMCIAGVTKALSSGSADRQVSLRAGRQRSARVS